MSKQRKICLVSPVFFKEGKGGTEIQMYRIAKEFTRRGWEVHFIAEDGTEYTAYSNGGGVYWLKLPRGNYTAYAEYAWYKSEEMEVKIDAGRTPINFYVEIPYSRSGRPGPNP